jgi:2'-5' RNA ligase
METAIVIAVPESDPIVERWIREHTTAGADGMPPHITLLYPFVDTSQYAARLGGHVEDVLRRADVMPIRFALASTAYFHGDPSTLYLAPEPAAPFTALTDALAHEFPAHPPYGGIHEEVIPHLTVAQSKDLDLLSRIEDDVSEHLPVDALATEAQLMERAPQGWRVRREFLANSTRKWASQDVE